MSLLSGLDSHDRNPCNKWGRYSSSKTTGVGDFSDNPENDFVQLISLSPSSQPTKRYGLRGHKQQKQEPIEISDDKYESKLRSNTDKNPKDFIAHMSNFTIPKTKKQTRDGKSTRRSLQEECLRNNGHRKVPTQLQLMPDAQGRATKRTSPSDGNSPRKLKRLWYHTPPPRGSEDESVSPRRPYRSANCSSDKVSPFGRDKLRVNAGNRFRRTSLIKTMEVHIVDLRSSQETSGEQTNNPEAKRGTESSRLTETPKSHHVEEMRCVLCNGVVTKAGCPTCPKSSDAESYDDELSPDEFLVPAKKMNEEPPGSGFRNDTTDETQTKSKDGQVPVNVLSSESQDSDFVETPDVPESNITQDDMFCRHCGKGKSGKAPCGCLEESEGHSTSNSSKFYSRTRNYSPLHRNHGGGSRIMTKRKRKPVNTKTNTKAKKKDPKQTTLSTTGDTKLPETQKTGGRKKKVSPPKEPECVHISSDDDEALETTDNPETKDDDDLDASLHRNDKSQETTPEPMQNSEEIESTEEKLDVKSSMDEGILNQESRLSLDYFKTKEKESVPGNTNDMGTKVNDEKQKKVEQKVFTHLEGSCRYMMVDHVLVGELGCVPREPVEISDDRILIKVTYKNENLDFSLGKNDVTSFKIHSECEPLIAILTITSGWARKYVQRYRQFNTYIDPGNLVYNKKYIMLILKEAITDTLLEELIYLIDNNLSDEPIVEKISQAEANNEGDRIISAFSTTMAKLKSANDKSSNDVNKTKKQHVPVTKTYSTRSKSSVVCSNVQKTPAKTILVYQPSSIKLDGVTITSEDMLCLEPSTYLNDVIIDFFFKYIIDEKLTPKDRDRLHLFSTFFYDRLTQKNTNSDEPRNPTNMHRMVKSWTKNVDIFSKDFLIIPINESSHWYLVIICYPRMVAEDAEKKANLSSDETSCPASSQESSEEKDSEKNYKDSDLDDFDTTLMQTIADDKKKSAKRRKSRESVSPISERPCVLVFDSLGTNRRSGVITNLRNYLNCEWKERKDSTADVIFNKDTLKGWYPKVPLQENFSDCGLYVLQYFECFFTNPIQDYKVPIDLRTWFTQDKMATKRQCIINTILDLQAKTESLKVR